jgi:hypothetical protein
MANVQESLSAAMQIDGSIGAALVDWASGMALGAAGGGSNFNLDIAAAGNTQVVRAKMSVMKNLNIKESIEDILITTDHQYHIIRPLQKHPKLFLYIALNRDQANLAMARYKLADIERSLEV